MAVWEEHLSVGAVRAAIEALYPTVLRRKAQVEAVPITVAFFCPPEETHDIGLRMLVDRFDLAGFRTVYVGALTPVAQMIECARSVGADVICLSASTHYQRATLFDVVKTVSRELPHVRIVAGALPSLDRAAGGKSTWWIRWTNSSATDRDGRRCRRDARRRGRTPCRWSRRREARPGCLSCGSPGGPLAGKSQSIPIILGIAVGIAVQVFVGSLITSLQDSLIESTVGSSSHVTWGRQTARPSSRSPPPTGRGCDPTPGHRRGARAGAARARAGRGISAPLVVKAGTMPTSIPSTSSQTGSSPARRPCRATAYS